MVPGRAKNERSGRGRRSRIFTAYLRSLTTGGPQDPSLFDRSWEALKSALIAELRLRGLWTSPPGYLGLVGSEIWDAAALEELTADAYAFNFVDRLRSLRAQLEVKPNIDGLVRLNLKNFLYERQRRCDPLGYRLYQILVASLDELVRTGELRLADGESSIGNDSVLLFSEARTIASKEPDHLLESHATRWSDDLLPGLVTSRGELRDDVTGELSKRIAQLRRDGIERFRVKELADPLKKAVRARWSALATAAPDVGGGDRRSHESDEDGGFLELRERYRPFQEIEDLDSFEKLIDCVEIELRRLDTQEAEGEYLNTLWRYLRLYAAGERDLPSRRKLGELLGIPRNRFPDLYGRLGGLIEGCRVRLAGPAGRGDGRTRA